MGFASPGVQRCIPESTRLLHLPLEVPEACSYLAQALLAEWAAGPVVQTPLQALLAEGVAARRGHWLQEQPAE